MKEDWVERGKDKKGKERLLAKKREEEMEEESKYEKMMVVVMIEVCDSGDRSSSIINLKYNIEKKINS